MLNASVLRPALGLAALLVGVAVTPVACLSGYVFDLPPGTGGSSSASSIITSSTVSASSGSSTSTGISNGGASSVSSTGSAGSAVSSTTSTSTATSSSSSGGTCATLDCSVPGCGQCVPTTPPAGWTGYFSVFDGAPAADPNTCAGSFPTQEFAGSAGVMFDQAGCPCDCSDGPNGSTCTIPELSIGDAACTGNSNSSSNCTCPVDTPAGYVPGACYNLGQPTSGVGYYACIAGTNSCGPKATDCSAAVTGGTPCNVSASAPTATVSGGSCTGKGTPTTGPITWSSAGLACGGATPGVGCGASDTCLPPPATPFQSGVCIMQTGVVACPAAQFTEQHVFYTGTDDTRTCTACTCGTPTGQTCAVTYAAYSSNGATPTCSSEIFTVQSGECVAVSNTTVNAFTATITTPPTGGMCSKIPGMPMGTVTPTGATTFCCIP